jgi:indole-3-glycerol phosphate synthase
MAGPETPTILRRILARKAEEIAERQRHTPLARLRERAAAAPPVRGFYRALEESVAAGRRR